MNSMSQMVSQTISVNSEELDVHLSQKEILAKRLAQVSLSKKTLYKDPGTKPSIKGVVSTTITNIKLSNSLGGTSSSCYVSIKNKTNTKRTNLLRFNSEIRITKHLGVVVPKFKSHPYNIVRLELYVDDELCGNLCFNLHDIIKVCACCYMNL